MNDSRYVHKAAVAFEYQYHRCDWSWASKLHPTPRCWLRCSLSTNTSNATQCLWRLEPTNVCTSARSWAPNICSTSIAPECLLHGLIGRSNNRLVRLLQLQYAYAWISGCMWEQASTAQCMGSVVNWRDGCPWMPVDYPCWLCGSRSRLGGLIISNCASQFWKSNQTTEDHTSYHIFLESATEFWLI